MSRIIQIVNHNPQWPHLYREEARRIVEVLSDQIILIHHIGSTAIPGIKAKPILDCLVEVRKIEAIDGYNELMKALGYEPRGEYGIPGRRYFVKGTVQIHTFHLHVFESGHPDVNRHLDFRDYLRANPQEAQIYSRLKENLSGKYPYDSVAYTEGKSEFIGDIEKRAILRRAG